jgi:hypothetical protein
MTRRPAPEVFMDDDGTPCIVDHRGVWTEAEWVADRDAWIARDARLAYRLAAVGAALAAVSVVLGVVGMVRR